MPVFQPLLPAFEPDQRRDRPTPSRFRSPPPPPEPSAMVKPPCISAPRRRTKTTSHSLRRRRLVSRAEYCREHSPLHAFDKLPWIASLDAPPAYDHPWDIADLSLIPDPTTTHIRPSGLGPTRRRKVSPRSSPMSDDTVDDIPLQSYNIFPRDAPSRPLTPTPAPRFDPTRVTFRHLMPVSDDDV
ncbi:hypothetical protein P691DRAFT_250114 [Macrolepiota fuliginosa MF-IS2]|uniref:Uncharacterized protein n=1 Tax=Macrolepiota fuliginosa MF-IS2 TaxID=1400762 RepID=A0A9P6C8M8_9AGAR|nr:hypothetical protein P691DRAFT_250114 [Macrolepiota fuliginosa MF-IS2]